jgi:sugar phosphate isomerase/epimerase
MEKDYEETLGLIADLGYAEVEFGSTYGVSKFDFKNALKSYGLKPVAGGASISELQKKLDQYIDDALFFERLYVICYWPWLDGGLDKTLDDFKVAADRLNKIGEQVRKEGLRFAFHNHDKEFVDVGDGKLGYDIILEATDPSVVDMEIDLYWVKKGNADPLEYFDKYPGRFKICHVKDMDKTPDRSFEIVGKGIIDFQQIFEESDKAGLQHFIVEQDNAPDPVATVTESINYLKQLNF